MIIIYLKGGLGNQLFQIFAGISYSKNYQQDFFICDSFFKNVDAKTTPRNTYWDTFLKHFKNKVLNIEKDDSFKTIKEIGFEYNEFPKYLGNTWLNGYFQSYKYFEKHYDYISNILKIKQNQEYVRNKYKYDYKNICSIHFRFGDYKKNPDHHLLLDQKYYINATELILKTNDIKKFLVFYEREDINQINLIIESLKNINKSYNFTLVDYSIPDYFQLILMSICHSNIIANSSFSWWGAYMNSNPDKIVIRPSKWFGPKMRHNNIKDLCPDNWKIIII